MTTKKKYTNKKKFIIYIFNKIEKKNTFKVTLTHGEAKIVKYKNLNDKKDKAK